MLRLETPIKALTRVGLATANKMSKLGVKTIEDLLLYFPFRYEDYTQNKKITDLKPGEAASVIGVIELISAKISPRMRMRMTEALIRDESDGIQAIWFNQPYLAKTLKVGQRVRISGKVSESRYGMQFQNPSYEIISDKEELENLSLTPIYPLTQGITQKQLSFLTAKALESVDQFIETFPESIRKKYNLVDIRQALRDIHFPKDQKVVTEARRRLAFEELFYIMLQSSVLRNFVEDQKSNSQKFFEKEIKEFVESLSYKLTDDQRKASWQILQDLSKEKPMNRLLEGDVGSGKTIVSAVAAYNTFLNKEQAVVMAPTTILANQHYETFLELFEKVKIKIAILTQAKQEVSGKKSSKSEIIELLKEGEVDIVIGTHALLSEGVFYNNIGLVVIDEQHRFGVKQRQTLKSRNLSKNMPHFLSMTATPIPRSLALIVYGELDVSLLTQKPAGRKEIKTDLVKESERKGVYEFIRKELRAGKQGYVICPLIDPSDSLGVTSVKEEYEHLRKNIFKDLRVGLLHGKLKADEKEKIMNDFKDNKLQLLVSTSVIEVGVNVPNATIMVIEGAERFGLAQLHQFRGRVGRSDAQSYCFLFPSIESEQYDLARLALMEKTNDGFALAEYDLKTRGPGEVYGTRQSGMIDFKLADLNDKKLVYEVKECVDDFITSGEYEKYPLIKKRIEEKLEEVHLE